MGLYRLARLVLYTGMSTTLITQTLNRFDNFLT